MSTDDMPIIYTLEARLRELLVKAHTLKPTSIDPPLSPAQFVRDIIDIAQLPHNASDNPPDSSPSITSRQAALETAARTIFYEQVALCSTNDTAFIQICNLLDILQFCADHGQCESSLPLWLVEELLDSQTIDGCKRVFDFLESRRERMITDTFQKSKQLIVLRSCNELLRRLSRAEDAVFCGRVFMFLFQSFPLGDKSSVNLRGEFHVENTTSFDIPKETAEDGDKMEVDTADKLESADPQAGDKSVSTEVDDSKPVAVAETTKPSNTEAKPKQEEQAENIDALYATFWSLQQAFSNPTKVFAPTELEKFKSGLEATIKKFKSVNKVIQTRGTTRAPGDQRRGIKRKRNGEHDEFASNFNPKYLTSRDLFELEMSDLTFQRHILVQALIFIDFLYSLTPKAKKKLAELKAQKAMIYPFTLSPEDATWANTTRNTIETYLQSGPEGKFYYRMVSNVLSRDKNWVRWKVESCPPISLPSLPTPTYVSAVNGAKRACAPKRIRPTPLGSMDLGFLYDDGGGGGNALAVMEMEKLRVRGKWVAPSVEEYLAEIAPVALDLEMALEVENRNVEERKGVEGRLKEMKKVKMERESAEKEQERAEKKKEVMLSEQKLEETKEIEMMEEKLREKKRGERKAEDVRKPVQEKRASIAWRILRLTAKARLNIFDGIDENKNLDILGPPREAGETAEVESEQVSGQENGDTDAVQKFENTGMDTLESEAEIVKQEETAEQSDTVMDDAVAAVEEHGTAVQGDAIPAETSDDASMIAGQADAVQSSVSSDVAHPLVPKLEVDVEMSAAPEDVDGNVAEMTKTEEREALLPLDQEAP